MALLPCEKRATRRRGSTFPTAGPFDSFPHFLAEVAPWVSQGKIKYSEFVDGFEKTPESFLKLFNGNHDGKRIVRIG
jgi:hypothetical protein